MSYYNDLADDLLEQMLGDDHPYHWGKQTYHMPVKLTIDDKRKVAVIEVPLLDVPQESSTKATVSIAQARNEHTQVVHSNGKPLKVTCQVYFKP